ncbi:nucleotide exchange factor GrpE [Puniceicoccales bacterium CK1056]|uniref:Protein GrpE n=1 Tax=Oceanipulchritudo coccoides TaxID=2706888 RepID=A0A6B2M1G6_9BACT|nr:nucleotide exchange factor GrpE [Oceanipulchritudo coccoides]NDV62192.1 nucleotide exchange factor GrpE [Oceanipulchritudo coccoides]
MSKNSDNPENQNPEEQSEEVKTPEEASQEQEQAVHSTEPDAEISGLLKKLDEATAEISEQKERYLRTVADLENYRKRAVREKDEARRQANCGLMEDLLPILDNFRLGLKSAESHEGGAVFAEGFRMILGQMESTLRQNGLEEINPEKGPFDPNFHEAVAHVPHDEVADGEIIEVHRIGYKLHERLLRPASVLISSGPAEVAAETSEAEEK